MESSKVIHAFYTDDEVLLDAVKTVKAAHHHIEEVFCPFPVHGLDKAMGLAPTRLAITAFLYGITGLGFAIWMTNYMMIDNWPQDILEIRMLACAAKHPNITGRGYRVSQFGSWSLG